jgi:hypothetical protein
MGYKGPKYTWCNFRDEQHFIKERLDRVLANVEWITAHPTTEVEVGDTTYLNHLPIHVALKKLQRGHQRKNGFKYEVAWAKEKECKEVIKKEWRIKNFNIDTWNNVSRKLDKCKRGLMHWQHVVKKNQQNLIKEKKKQLAHMHDLKADQDAGSTKKLLQS